MNTKTKLWIHKGLAALIGGGASAVTSTISAGMIAPDKFNLSGEFGATLKLALVTFGFNAFLSVMFYLKQSPLPPADGETSFITNPNPPSGG